MNEQNQKNSIDEQTNNGTRHNTFLNKIKQYNAQRIQSAREDAHASKAQARRLANQRLSKAHQKAAANINAGQLDAIYLLSQGNIVTLPPKPESQELETLEGHGVDLALDATSGDVYAVRNGWPNEIGVFKGGSGPFRALRSADSSVSSLAVRATGESPSERALYWIAGDKSLWRGDLEGNAAEPIVPSLPGPVRQSRWQVAVDEDHGKLYWTNDREIWRANLDGSGPEIVVGNADAPFPVELAVDGEHGLLFWIDKDLGMLCRADLNGQNIKHLYPVRNPGHGLDVDPGQRMVYWIERQTGLSGEEPGLSGLWRFEGGQGETVTDLSGHEHQAALHGVTWHRPMVHPPSLTVSGWVLEFDGEADYMTLEPVHLNDAKGVTVEMWVRLSALEQATTLLDIGNRFEPILLDWHSDVATDILSADGTPVRFAYTTGELGSGIHIERCAFTAPEGCVIEIRTSGSETRTYRTDQRVIEDVDLFIRQLPHEGGGYGNLFYAGRDNHVWDYWKMEFWVAAVPGEAADPHWRPPVRFAYTTGEAGSGIQSEQRAFIAPEGCVIEIRTSGSETRTYRTDQRVIEDVDLFIRQLPHEGGGYGNLFYAGGDNHVWDYWKMEFWVVAVPGEAADPTVGSTRDNIVLTFDDIKHNETANPTAKVALHVSKGGAAMSVCSDFREIPIHEWLHVAATIDSDGQSALYLDGQVIGSGNVELPGVAIRNQAFVGKRSADAAEFLNGQLAEIRLWNQARSAHQIESGMKDYSTSYVMSVSMDGWGEAHQLYEVPGCQGGLNVQSRTKEAHGKRLKAIHERALAKRKAAEQRERAHAQAKETVQRAHEELQAKHVEADQTLSEAHASANQKRAKAHSDLNAAHAKARQQVATARQSAETRRQQAREQAEQIKGNARARGNEMKRQAQDKLNNANAEKAKYN